jgi:hypothetical protein
MVVLIVDRGQDLVTEVVIDRIVVIDHIDVNLLNTR